MGDPAIFVSGDVSGDVAVHIRGRIRGPVAVHVAFADPPTSVSLPCRPAVPTMLSISRLSKLFSEEI